MLYISTPNKRRKQNVARPATSIITVVVFAIIFIFSSAQWNAFVCLEATLSATTPSLLTRTRDALAQAKVFREKPFDAERAKFIIFHKIRGAQGAGNHMSGLLAAHLLADEFARVVCVSDHYKDFHVAFESVDPVAMELCPAILDRYIKEPPYTTGDRTISMLNYHKTPVNECRLKEKLSSAKRVIHMTANTYPRWPQIPPHVNFFAFYKAKSVLLDILPYPHASTDPPPPIVVHLRLPDVSGKDARKGVDEQALHALGELLTPDVERHSPFLVTNNVEWYDFFENQYNWSHPIWGRVFHSALGAQWKGRKPKLLPISGRNGDTRTLQRKYTALRNELGEDKWESLQLWADWYTLLRAEKVYHTFSDFSLSAVHWMNTWSRTYDGINNSTGEMILLEENWIVDGESPRLVDRTGDQLHFCDT